MSTQNLLTPTSLSYAAALRGVKPRPPGAPFVYVSLNCVDIDYFICLAASNPESKFYTAVSDEFSLSKAKTLVASRQVSNVSFIPGAPADILANVKNGTASIPAADYVIFDGLQETGDRAAIFDLAQALLSPSGLFGYRYRVSDLPDGHLRFLVQEFAPEMNAEQAIAFLSEIKTLGGFYFADHKQQAAELGRAIASRLPDEFFSKLDGANVKSGTFDTLVEMSKRAFTFAGDSHIPSNYIELAVPAEAQQRVINSRDNPLYESIKDFALNRLVRADVWCKRPVTLSDNLPELFGGFTFGTSLSSDQMPHEIKAQGKIISLTSPLFAKLLKLMVLMPITVGDFLSHKSGKTFKPADVVEAVQVLVACGIAYPMRGLAQNEDVSNVAQPRFSGTYNQMLGDAPVNSAEIRFASTIVGAPITVSAREALVMQALNRAGLANSVTALLPELQRVTQNPALAAHVIDTSEATSETAQAMIKNVVNHSIVRWYALGLLRAA